jgi:hypothetical protein
MRRGVAQHASGGLVATGPYQGRLRALLPRPPLRIGLWYRDPLRTVSVRRWQIGRGLGG